MKALYTRGFTINDNINTPTGDWFQAALSGTIAYPFASQIQTEQIQSEAVAKFSPSNSTQPMISDPGWAFVP